MTSRKQTLNKESFNAPTRKEFSLIKTGLDNMTDVDEARHRQNLKEIGNKKANVFICNNQMRNINMKSRLLTKLNNRRNGTDYKFVSEIETRLNEKGRPEKFHVTRVFHYK